MEQVIPTDNYHVRFGEILNEVTDQTSRNLVNTYVSKASFSRENGHELDTPEIRDLRLTLINETERAEVEKHEAYLSRLVDTRNEALNKGILSRENYASINSKIKDAESKLNVTRSAYEAKQLATGEAFQSILLDTARAKILDLFSDPLAFYEDKNLSYPISINEVKVISEPKIEPEKEPTMVVENDDVEETTETEVVLKNEHEDLEKEEVGETLKAITVGVAEKPKHNEDVVKHTQNGLYLVLDGMGGHGPKGSAKRAASIAANELLDKLDNLVDVETAKASIESAFGEANNKVTSESGGGATTATAVKLIEAEDGSIKAVWASVGDSRLYLYRDGEITQITKDEGFGFRVTNGLGVGNGFKLNQIDTIDLKSGDRLMLCSDGITGDYEYQEISDENMHSAFSEPTAQDSANKFLEYSKKSDDKSVIVIQVGEFNAPNVEATVIEASSDTTEPEIVDAEEVITEVSDPSEEDIVDMEEIAPSVYRPTEAKTVKPTKRRLLRGVQSKVKNITNKIRNDDERGEVAATGLRTKVRSALNYSYNYFMPPQMAAKRAAKTPKPAIVKPKIEVKSNPVEEAVITMPTIKTETVQTNSAKEYVGQDLQDDAGYVYHVFGVNSDGTVAVSKKKQDNSEPTSVIAISEADFAEIAKLHNSLDN